MVSEANLKQVKILRGVDYDDLKRLFHVSKPIREVISYFHDYHSRGYHVISCVDYMALYLLHQSEDPATMILLSKTAAGVAVGIVMLKMVPETPLQFGVAERLSRTIRAESTGIHAEAPKMLWAYSATAQMKCDTAFGIRRVTMLSEAEILHLWTRFIEPENDSIVGEHGLSSEITQSPGGSSITSEGFENSGRFEDSRRSNEEDSEDGASSNEGGSETPQVRRSTGESRAPVRYSLSANYLLLTKNGEPECDCADEVTCMSRYVPPGGCLHGRGDLTYGVDIS
ncbi:hypothetical protein Tco_1065103 [Tanacetum coccineum]